MTNGAFGALRAPHHFSVDDKRLRRLAVAIRVTSFVAYWAPPLKPRESPKHLIRGILCPSFSSPALKLVVFFTAQQKKRGPVAVGVVFAT
jgi:hypothetical protein